LFLKNIVLPLKIDIGQSTSTFYYRIYNYLEIKEFSLREKVVFISLYM